MRTALAGAASVIVDDVFIQDSTSTTGAGLSGLAFNTAGLTCYYHRNVGSASVAVSLATMTLGTWATGGFKEVDATHMPGVYSFCPPDAAIAAGAQSVTFFFQGATNMVPTPVTVQLVAYNPQDAAAIGLSRLDTTVSSRMATYAQPTGFLAATFPGTVASTTNITAGTITTVTNQLTTAAIATGVWQDATAGDFTVSSSIGKSLYTGGVVPGGTNGLFIAGTNAATVITTSLTTTFTGNLTGSAGSVIGGATSSALSTLQTTANTINVNTSGLSGVTFPSTVASPTNITAGTITTVTNLTNLPAITAGWLTATGIASDAITAAKIADGAIDTATFASGTTIPRCTLTDTVTTYTGNTVQTGDSFARIGAAGAGLTALGDTRIANLDATVSSRGTSTLTQTQVTGGAYSVQSSSCVLGDARIANLDAAVSSRMATYAQPTGFLAATFPGTVASTTNITAGTITTVTTTTNLTNLPAITAGWITATGIAADAITAAKIADGAIDTATFASGTTIPRCTLVDTTTTLTNAAGDSSGVTTLLTRIGSTLTITGGAVTVGTNNDKTGYTLTVTPPTAAAIATTIWTDLLAGSDFSTSASIGKLLKDDIDTTVSSRMATYAQPTGFLGATFPGTVASTTNITAGTITTVTTTTNLTNAPTSGDLTATMKASVTTAATAATPIAASVAGAVGSIAAGGITTATFASGATIPRCTLVDTLTVYTGNTVQTGDSFARIGAAGASLTSLAPAAVWAFGTRTLTGAVTVGTNADKSGYSLISDYDAAKAAAAAGAAMTLTSAATSAALIAALGAKVTTDHGVGSYVSSGTSGPTLSEIVNGVWNEVLAGHTTAGSAAVALNNSSGGQLGANALDNVLVATGLSSSRIVDVDGNPVAAINVRQAIALLLAAFAGDRTGIGTRAITANLPDVTDGPRLVATRTSASEIEAALTVPE